jgi:hypothetical protein
MKKTGVKKIGALNNNAFENTQTSITEQDINKIEETFKFNFPTDFRRHYLIYNGRRPKKHVFIDEDYEFIVGYFIPIKHGVNDRILERVLEIFRDDQDFPNWLIPFADGQVVIYTVLVLIQTKKEQYIIGIMKSKILRNLTAI